jgi:hypothetical protein
VAGDGASIRTSPASPCSTTQLLVGRGELTERTLALLDERSVAVTGERRLGKTSFLHTCKGF